jgi:hypothetical protein
LKNFPDRKGAEEKANDADSNPQVGQQHYSEFKPEGHLLREGIFSLAASTTISLLWAAVCQ